MMTSVVLAVGVVDGIVSREWDFLAVFTLALLLQIVLLARLSRRRPAVPIRRDLVRWVREQAAVTGDSMETVTDRAISAYRDGFTDLDRSDERSTRAESESEPRPPGSAPTAGPRGHAEP